MTNEATRLLADRIFAAIERGDVDSVAELWDDDVEVWHNTDDNVQDKVTNLAVLAWMAANTEQREYRDIERIVTDDGFVQQHVLHVAFADGRTAAIPAALIVKVANGRVTRIDEYLDSRQVDAAFGPR